MIAVKLYYHNTTITTNLWMRITSGVYASISCVRFV